MASIDIFIGDLIEHASERATLARAVEIIAGQGIPAVILANLNLKDLQIDLVICFDQGVLVVEAKGLLAAVRGSENGDWEVRVASGRWKKIRNGYAQALKEKLALHDAMTGFAGSEVPYPDAALICVPCIPSGSMLSLGDFKVRIAGLDSLRDRIVAIKRHGWSLDQWRAFAGHHRLEAVSSIDVAMSPKLLDAERLLAGYGSAFARMYGPLASAMVPVSCVHDDKTLSSVIVLDQVAQKDNVLLTGESGCSKSLLSYAIAMAALGRGHVPIVVASKDFDGNLRDVANREATMLGAPSVKAVISAARLLDRRLLLVVDGYNECTPSERQRLTRSVAAAVRKFNAIAVVSSRISLERDDLLPVYTYTVQAPDIGTKRAIAQQAAGGASIEAFSDLLGSVRSGLEANMIGLLGRQLPAETSKYGLFDAFVRDKLGPAATDGIRALSRVAARMTERISFGLSVRELDRLSDREGIPGVLLQALQDANILDKRGDRVSFSHEMFLNVFAAEAILRRAGDNPEAVVTALRLPQHLEMKPFVLGAIDDDTFRRRVLSDLSDSQVIRACLAGHCGSDAQSWANQRCDDVLAQISEEIETVRFDASEKFDWRVQAMPETLQNWTTQDRAVLAAIPHELLAGRRLDDVLNLIGRMDERLAEEYRTLLDQSGKKIDLRSGLYAVSYRGFGIHKIGLSEICSPVHCGQLYFGPKVAACVDLHRRLHCETLSPGQVGLLIELYKYSDRDATSLGTVLPRLLSRIWPDAAYHLRLELMHAAGMCAGELNEIERRVLIDAIEALLVVDGGHDLVGMIDALKYLGALADDESQQVAGIKAQIKAVLEDPDNVLARDAAAGLWNAQFDHPYNGAYCEAWNDLASEDRKALLLMAAQSVERDSMFSAPLIAEVASHADPAVGPILARWTALPPKNEVMIGDAICSFGMAYAALARLHCRLPDRLAEAVLPADQALLACGEMIYWLNRDDLPKPERRRSCAGPLAILSRHETGVAATMVGDFLRRDFAFSEGAKRLPGSEPVVTSFGGEFPDEVAAIYRAALVQPKSQTGYFEFFRVEDTIEKALANLGHFGNKSDIPLLRAWSCHPKLGHFAVRAIKTIEEAPHQVRHEPLRVGGRGPRAVDDLSG